MKTPRLQDETGKRNPFDLHEQEAILNIVKTADQIQNRIGKLFRDFGLTSSQYNLLSIVRGEGKPMPCLEIANRMIQAVPAMTGLIDRLESQDLVKRTRCKVDRRIIYIDLTPKALNLLKSIDKPLEHAYLELLGHMTRDELASLSQLLEKARHRPDQTKPDSELTLDKPISGH